MKRCITFFSILILCTTILIGCSVIDKMSNRKFKNQYYVQIISDGQKENVKSQSGETDKAYRYKLNGFDKEGQEKIMDFTADKNLRKEAFLRVYYSDERGVTSWEEIELKDIPEKAKQKLNVK
ncbi:YxeA family protein [Bacillus toyonensis]|uniref:YxeA family protein n=1 Tax=Bacillus toyonensis TaxID=155322 RepID=A0A2B5WV03_9BACI|nr:YxeA family protein [Bacillus toyonensis]PGA87963.1 hypothetical protein COL93_29250 [Bacillus toyonensis]PHD58939.1 hypothetical protein COF40_28610 [Bacillus toyonensis]